VNTDNSFTSPWISLEIEHALLVGKPIYSLNFTNDSNIFKQVKYYINNGIKIDDAEVNKIRT
tara:strand:+ start:2929 stop:3114 length:186 start_codon:yes stop_codon:yes gene_type:complete